MTLPLAIDFFCGSGGVSDGLKRAGFNVVGVDIEPQPHYPFPFYHGDAFWILHKLIRGDVVYFQRHGTYSVRLADVALIWASPPCQGDSAMQHAHNSQPWPSFIRKTRRALVKTGTDWCIENVIGAPMTKPTILCGSHFGLGGRGFQLRRHRQFEATFPIPQPTCAHDGPVVGVYGGHVRLRSKLAGGRGTRDFPEITDKPAFMAEVMGIDRQMTMNEMSQAIPPAYAEHVGKAAIAHWRSKQ